MNANAVPPQPVAAIPDGQIVLCGVVGSRAYGLSTERSDIDRLGVFAAPLEQILGLDGPAALERTVVGSGPDVTFHELAKFVRLTLRCNPTVSELLWLDAYETVTDTGRELVALREAFLAERPVRDAYLGYAAAQAERITRRHRGAATGDDLQRAAKHGRHCLRLLWQAEQLLTTGQLQLDMSDRRTEIFEAGELAASDPLRFAEIVSQRQQHVAALSSVLPEHADRTSIDAFLVRARRRDVL